MDTATPQPSKRNRPSSVRLWLEVVKEVRAENPKLPLKEILILASKKYKEFKKK